MAVTKITWENKTGIQNDESVARKNKVMDGDMNEIKQVVNNNADELNTAQSNIENLQSGQGTANTDITNLKSRVSTLETDNTTNKSNIQQLQSKQQETETNVETLQEKVTTLETDNTQNKSDISALKTDNETNKSNISTLQEEQLNQNKNIEDLQKNDEAQEELILKLEQENKNIKSAIINVETEQAKSLHIEDGSTAPAQLSVEGNAEQGGEPSPSNPVSIKCLGSNKNIYPGWEHGTISSDTGNNAYDPRYIRSIDFISVFPNKEYTIKAYNIENINQLNTAIRMYDSNKEYLEDLYVGMIHVDSKTFIITNENVKYIKIVSSNNSAITETSKVDIKLEEGEEATSYSPYGQGSTKISKINENLFDKNNYIKIYDGQVNSSGVINTSDARHKTLLIECRPNVELSAFIKNKNNSYSRLLSCFDEEPVAGETKATAMSSSPNGLHITTTSKTKYLAIYLGATFDENWVSLQDIIDSVMLVKGNVSLTSKDYVEHKQSNYILNIQQEMLQNDYFDLKTLEEVHNWSEINVSELLSKDIAIGSASTEQYYVFQIPLGNENQIAEKVLCEKLKFLGFEKATNQREEEGIAINQDTKRFGRIWIKASRLSEKSISAFLSWCAEENIVVKALIEENETRLPMTSEQIEIIKQLSNLALFDGTNNIITTEDIALLKLKYVVDTKTYIDNQINERLSNIETQILELAGGN